MSMVHLPNNKECAKNKFGTYVNCNNVAEGRICFVGGDTTGNFPITPPIAEEKHDGYVEAMSKPNICQDCGRKQNDDACPAGGWHNPTQPTSDWEENISQILQAPVRAKMQTSDIRTPMLSSTGLGEKVSDLVELIAQAKEEGRREGYEQGVLDTTIKDRKLYGEDFREKVKPEWEKYFTLATITLFEEWCGSNSDRLPDTQTKKGAPIVFVADLLSFAEKMKANTPSHD